MIIRKYFFLLGIEFNNESEVIACLYFSDCNQFFSIIGYIVNRSEWFNLNFCT